MINLNPFDPQVVHVHTRLDEARGHMDLVRGMVEDVERDVADMKEVATKARNEVADLQHLILERREPLSFAQVVVAAFLGAFGALLVASLLGVIAR